MFFPASNRLSNSLAFIEFSFLSANRVLKLLLTGDGSLKFDLSAKAFEIPANRRDRQLSAASSIGDRAVSRLQLPVDVGFIPLFGVPNIRDRKIVLLGPEEWNGAKYFAAAKNVACSGLSLALGHDKMFDADSFAGEPIGPAGDVAGCEDVRGTGLKIFVHRDAAIDGEP